ncbi:TAD2 [Candida oxycetoniae]|uniref:TAD2 n=1 Tax=Candida oxycetoniae TaxID=497107 RepID=A0AAI9WXN3_9ASCO|nr:TAD2 [Candida oxycetoniae]KAI3404422.2 TAD2 [Candida oxycetoniae]
MAIALFIGYKALLNNETPVACIVTKGTQIISIGYNYTNNSLNGTKHAEFIAFSRLDKDKDKDKKNIDNCLDDDVDYGKLTLYVTVEPCIMCASYLRQLGIGRVIYGCSNDRFGGTGTILSVHKDSRLPNSPFQSIGGVCRTEAIQLLRNFYIQENVSAPVPKVKKNINIDEKEFPPVDTNLLQESFRALYGEQSAPVKKNQELTPIYNQGYCMSSLLTMKDLETVPFLQEELGNITEAQLQEFYTLFYDIDRNGLVVYEKSIQKYQLKRRKLDEMGIARVKN